MRKIILLMHVSLDGFVCGPNGEMDWIKLGDEMWDYVTEITDSADTALYGEVTYRMMEDYWPTAAEQPHATKHDVDHAKWVNAADKIVFSKTLQETHWSGARIVRDRIAEEIDEYRLNVNPVVIGAGKPLFRDIKDRMNLKLVEEKAFSTGVVALHYDLIK
jgi:dihydrofolate reductase